MIHVFGCGGHSLVILDILEQQYTDSIIFYDDKPAFTGNLFEGHGFSGAIKDCLQYANDDYFIVAIGNNKTRKSIYEQFLSKMRAAIVIHNDAVVSCKSTIKSGSVVFACSVVNRNVKIGENVIINTGAIIEHECKIGNHTHIAPSATICGGVNVGSECLIGAGSTILPGLTIGNNSIIGAGSTIKENIPPGKVIKNVY